MNGRYYIAYGSNLNKEHMLLRCPGAELIGTAQLPGYRLLFRGKWHESWLTIDHEKDSSVPVAVWVISPRDEMILDRYEGYPVLYYKEEILLPSVDCGDSRLENITAFVYIMHAYTEPALPSPDYVVECMDGYRDFGFDPDLIQEALRKTQQQLEPEES